MNAWVSQTVVVHGSAASMAVRKPSSSAVRPQTAS
jgi:hypothetical protein